MTDKDIYLYLDTQDITYRIVQDPIHTTEGPIDQAGPEANKKAGSALP